MLFIIIFGRLSFSITPPGRAAPGAESDICDCLVVGYFEEKIDCEFGIVYHKMYMHQKYIRLFVLDTYAVLKPGSNGGLVLNVRYPSVNSSTDMRFSNPIAYQGGSW